MAHASWRPSTRALCRTPDTAFGDFDSERMTHGCPSEVPVSLVGIAPPLLALVTYVRVSFGASKAQLVNFMI